MEGKEISYYGKYTTSQSRASRGFSGNAAANKQSQVNRKQLVVCLGHWMSVQSPVCVGQVLQGPQPPRQTVREGSRQHLVKRKYAPRNVRDRIFIMNRKKIQVKIVADSRGKFLKTELQRLNDSTIHFNTRYRKGAKLIDLWEIVEEELFKGQADLIIIYGGVCDITDITYDNFGRRFFWPPTNIRGRFTEIKSLMSGLAANYNLLNTSVKLCFMPEPGLNLAMVNRLPIPTTESEHKVQMDLENELTDLRSHTKHVNDTMSIITPWSLKITHLRRQNIWYPVYRRMHDGLHPTVHQAYKLAILLKEFSKRALYHKRGSIN